MRCCRLVLAILLTSAVSAQEPRPIPPEQYDKILGLIKPQKGEWAWAELPWTINFADAQRRSRLEGKPIFVANAAQGSVVGCA